MKAYAIAHVQSAQPGPQIVEYLTRIDATLAPFDGQFLVHGDPGDVREGDFVGNVIVIEFPTRRNARAWYESAEYQQILPLRTRNTTGWLILVDGVGSDHVATDILVPESS